MNEQEALDKMVAPGTRRSGKYREGVIQIHVTRACDQACFGCTQGSNLGGKNYFMSPDLFEQAVDSLADYFGVVGVFGGNPAIHPMFETLCEIIRKKVPYEQRGIWSNHPITPSRARAMRETFCPSVSNLNVHMSEHAYRMFKENWPECNPVGLTQDSRHSPPYVAIKDVIKDESTRWDLISNCDINKHWSAMIGMFRGELRAWFCEVAGAQSILHQDEPDYPDTGLILTYPDGSHCWFDTDVGPYDQPIGGKHGAGKPIQWWQLPMTAFTRQVQKHCHDCGIPLRGYGELAVSHPEGKEQVSETHSLIFNSKRRGRVVELVQVLNQVKPQSLNMITKYLQNSLK